MDIDYEALRVDLEHFALGAHFGGHIDAAILYYDKIAKANEEELIQIARECNFPVDAYIIEDHKIGK